MAGQAPGRAGTKARVTAVRRAPYWVPWDGAPEILSKDGKAIVGIGEPTGRVRLLPKDDAHTGLVKDELHPEGRSAYEAKRFVPLEYAPDEAKIQFYRMREAKIAQAKALGTPWEDLTRKETWLVAYKHFADEGERLLADREQVKAGKGAADAA